MPGPMRAPIVGLVAFTLLAGGLLPFVQDASADHVYSHRYIVQGRVVDEAGQPVAGAEVEVQLKNWLPQDESVTGVCSQDRESQRHQAQASRDLSIYVLRTDALGDYRVCIHVHTMINTGSVVVHVDATNVEDNKNMNQRTSYVHLTVPDAEVAGGQVGDVETFEEGVWVRGRLWQPLEDSRNLEGIPVDGVALTDRRMNVTLQLGDGTELSQDVQTDSGYGEFDARFDYNGTLDGAKAIFAVQAGGETVTKEYDIDPAFRAFHGEVILSDPIRASESPGPGLVLAVVAVLGAALVAARRRA